MASELIVQTIKGPTSGANANKIIVPAGQTLDASAGFVPPAGSVVQVKHLTNNTQTSFSGVNPQTFMTLSITPSSTSSKIFLTYDVSLSFDWGGCHAQTYIYRGATPLGLAGTPDSNGTYAHKIFFIDGTSDNNMSSVSGSYLDSPSTTSSTTYNIACSANNGNTMYVNRRFLDGGHYMVSSMTLMEIAG